MGFIIIPNVSDEKIVVTWNDTESCQRLFAVLQQSGRNAENRVLIHTSFSPLREGCTVK